MVFLKECGIFYFTLPVSIACSLCKELINKVEEQAVTYTMLQTNNSYRTQKYYLGRPTKIKILDAMSVLKRRKDVKFKPQGRHSQLDRQTAPLVDEFTTLDSHKMLTSTKGFVDAISDISAVNNDSNQVSLGQKAFCYMKKTHLSMATVKMSEQLC